MQFQEWAHQLVKWVADDATLRGYVDPKLAKSNSGVLVAMVAFFGFRQRDDGACEHSFDPQYNMIEKQCAKHAAELAAANTQIEAADQRAAAALVKAEESRIDGERAIWDPTLTLTETLTPTRGLAHSTAQHSTAHAKAAVPQSLPLPLPLPAPASAPAPACTPTSSTPTA